MKNDDHRRRRLQLHVVVIPWLAFGHLNSFFSLSDSIARRGHRVTFISTPRNISRLPQTAQSSLLTLRSFPLNEASRYSGELSPEAESTADVRHPAAVDALKSAFDALKEPILDFLLSNSPPVDWFIHDSIGYWVPELAAELGGVPSVLFTTFSAVFHGFLARPWESSHGGGGGGGAGDVIKRLTEVPEFVDFSTAVAFRRREAVEVMKMFGSNNASAGRMTDGERFFVGLQGCKLIAMRSCEEFDSDWLRLFTKLAAKPVVSVGLLPPPPPPPPPSSSTAKNIFDWLDKQKDSSVVYVALGSEVPVGIELIRELAHGLELSELPFFWVLRIQSDTAGDQLEILPEGFESRIAVRGIVVSGWVPQVEILSHEAIGGFVTHCGWNSIIEGLSFGRPLILLPIFGDQCLNSRFMAEKEVGMEVGRDDDGGLRRASVASALRRVVVEEGGKEIRANARRMTMVVGNKELHQGYVDSFLEKLEGHVVRG